MLGWDIRSIFYFFQSLLQRPLENWYCLNMTQLLLSPGCSKILTFPRKTISAEWTQKILGKWRELLHFAPEYFQFIFSRFETGVPRKHQVGNSHPCPSTLGANLSLRYERTWEEKNNTGLQGAEITTHASPGTWTFQTAQKEIIFLKQLSSLMPFFGSFWQTIPSSASTCHSLSTALPTWEYCGRRFDWTRESNLQELRNWHSFSPS